MATGTVEVSNGPTATQLVSAGDGPCSITNGSSTDTIFLGDTNAIRSTDPSDVIPLGPGAAISVDGKSNLFAVASGSNRIAAHILKGGVASTAGDISVNGDVIINGQSGPLDINGVGGFVLPGQLALGFSNPGGVSATAGSGTNIVTAMDVSTYGSLIFRCNGGTSNSVAAGAAVCAQWVFTWLDAAGNALASEMVSVMLGMNLTIQMPIKGSKLLVQLLNVGSVGTISYGASEMFLWGDYRTVDSPYIVNNSVSIGGLTAVTGWVVIPPINPALTVGSWISNLQSSNIPALPSTQYLMPLATWCGDVLGWFQQTSNPLAHNATIIDLSYAVQGGIAPGTGFTGGIITNLELAAGTVPIDIEYNGTPTQLAFAFETTASLGDTFLMLTGRAGN